MPVSYDRKTLQALVEASQAIHSHLDVTEVFKRIAEQAAAVLDAEGASVLLYDGQRKELVFQTAVGPSAKPLVGMRFEAGLGIAGQVIKTGRGVCIDNVRENRHFFAGIDAHTGMSTRSMMVAPLSQGGQTFGVVEVINPKGRNHFNTQDLEVLGIFANLATVAALNAQAFDRLSKENKALRASHEAPHIVGGAPAMKKVLHLCQKVSQTQATVLIYGETGTGKELAARAIHASSPRRDKPFIALNCAALTETLLESELFGHEKGAFTGAVDQRLGKFELADQGTLFLDEVGETSMALQTKLLRVLQEREFVRVGGARTIACDVRIVAATNRDLKKEVDAGRFREDLYYRLNVFPIRVPPLRERIEDLPILVDHFIKRLAPELGVKPPSVTPEAMVCLMNYAWPGNIRELRNIIERCTLLAEDQIAPAILPQEVCGVMGATAAPRAEATASPAGAAGSSMMGFDGGSSGGSVLDQHERAIILKALGDCDWNQSEAARKLNISRDHLRYRMKKYEFKRPERT